MLAQSLKELRADRSDLTRSRWARFRKPTRRIDPGSAAIRPPRSSIRQTPPGRSGRASEGNPFIIVESVRSLLYDRPAVRQGEPSLTPTVRIS